MKISLKTSSFLLSIIFGLLGASTVLAEPVPTHVGFEAMNEKMTTIKSGTVEEKIQFPTQPPLNETGAIQFMHAPRFDFGKANKITIEAATYKGKYEETAPIENAASRFFIPPFIQVGDGSGKDNLWKVKVSQSVPFETTNGSKHKLMQSRISVSQPSLTNNVKQDQVNTLLDGITYEKAIPLSTDDELMIFNSKASTNGSISSAVFKTDYKEADYGVGKNINQDSTLDEVKLTVPFKEKVLATNYKTSLNWTLEVGP